MKKFCKSLEEHAMEIINFEKKKIILLADEEFKSCERQKNMLHLQKKK